MALTRAREPAAHLTTEQITQALLNAGGVLTATAKALRISRETLRLRLLSEPALAPVRDEAREVTIDIAEGVLLQALKSGDLKAAFYVLRTLGRSKGYGGQVDVAGDHIASVQHDRVVNLEVLALEELEMLDRLLRKATANDDDVSF